MVIITGCGSHCHALACLIVPVLSFIWSLWWNIRPLNYWKLAGNAANDSKKPRTIPRHFQLAIRNDDKLNKLLDGVTIVKQFSRRENIQKKTTALFRVTIRIYFKEIQRKFKLVSMQNYWLWKNAMLKSIIRQYIYLKRNCTAQCPLFIYSPHNLFETILV